MHALGSWHPCRLRSPQANARTQCGLAWRPESAMCFQTGGWVDRRTIEKGALIGKKEIQERFSTSSCCKVNADNEVICKCTVWIRDKSVIRSDAPWSTWHTCRTRPLAADAHIRGDHYEPRASVRCILPVHPPANTLTYQQSATNHLKQAELICIHKVAMIGMNMACVLDS